jgi:MYXO-CTERM domain-containing protein
MLARGWLVAMAFTPQIAMAQVSWRGDFETGDTSQYGYLLNPEIGDRRYLDVVTDNVAEGTYAARIELHNDAEWPNGLKRVEVQHAPEDERTAEGAELFFAWSFYLPETLPSDPDQQIGYWETNRSYQQMMAFAVAGEEMTFSTRRPENRVQWRDEGAATAGEWHRIAMRVVWSTSEDTGRVDVWFDGEHVVTDAAAATLADENPTFVQFGLLRGRIEFEDVPVIYVDHALEGDSLEAVEYDRLPGAMPDGGVDLDAGEPSDGGARADGGPRTDGGRRDGGGVTLADGGTTTEDEGCDCSTAEPTGAVGLVLAIGLVARRRSTRRA